jgi:hypothetical protein
MFLVGRDWRGGREARREASDQSSGPASGDQSAGPRRPAPGGSNKATTRQSNAGRVDQFRTAARCVVGVSGTRMESATGLGGIGDGVSTGRAGAANRNVRMLLPTQQGSMVHVPGMPTWRGGHEAMMCRTCGTYRGWPTMKSGGLEGSRGSVSTLRVANGSFYMTILHSPLPLWLQGPKTDPPRPHRPPNLRLPLPWPAGP